ncbi:hypothetical protein [Actinomadura sp. K4S16]|nr:hypothetical protein [Actinomadura sp. K4S16]
MRNQPTDDDAYYRKKIMFLRYISVIAGVMIRIAGEIARTFVR